MNIRGNAANAFAQSPMTEPLIVVGASSLVGRRLVKFLAQEPYAARYAPRFTSSKPCDGRLLLDLSRPDDFAPDDSPTTVVFCCPIRMVSNAALERLHALGMKRVLAFSSTSRFTKTDSAEPAERAAADDLIAAEDRLTTFARARDVAYTILRPTIIYDEGVDKNITRIAAFIQRFGFFIVCGRANGLRQPVHARDLAQAVLQVLEHDATRNQAYELSGGETLTYREMVRRIFEGLGRRPRIASLPAWAWRAGFGALGLLRGRRPSLQENVQMALRMNRDMTFDHADATQDFGYSPAEFHPQFDRSTG
jgi:nucleoside-diphosphate-sugar epimerase